MYTQEMMENLQGMQTFLNWVLACCILTDELAAKRNQKHSMGDILQWQENFHASACSFKVIGQ